MYLREVSQVRQVRRVRHVRQARQFKRTVFEQKTSPGLREKEKKIKKCNLISVWN